jgi:hypothetical protein
MNVPLHVILVKYSLALPDDGSLRDPKPVGVNY